VAKNKSNEILTEKMDSQKCEFVARLRRILRKYHSNRSGLPIIYQLIHYCS